MWVPRRRLTSRGGCRTRRPPPSLRAKPRPHGSAARSPRRRRSQPLPSPLATRAWNSTRRRLDRVDAGRVGPGAPDAFRGRPGRLGSARVWASGPRPPGCQGHPGDGGPRLGGVRAPRRRVTRSGRPAVAPRGARRSTWRRTSMRRLPRTAQRPVPCGRPGATPPLLAGAPARPPPLRRSHSCHMLAVARPPRASVARGRGGPGRPGRLLALATVPLREAPAAGWTRPTCAGSRSGRSHPPRIVGFGACGRTRPAGVMPSAAEAAYGSSTAPAPIAYRQRRKRRLIPGAARQVPAVREPGDGPSAG